MKIDDVVVLVVVGVKVTGLAAEFLALVGVKVLLPRFAHHLNEMWIDGLAARAANV
jgi:hypothetical protein